MLVIWSWESAVLLSLADRSIESSGSCSCGPLKEISTAMSMSPEQVEEIKHHFGVVAEALRSDIRQIAEGHSVIRHDLQEMRREVRDEFKEMRA